MTQATVLQRANNTTCHKATKPISTANGKHRAWDGESVQVRENFRMTGEIWRQHLTHWPLGYFNEILPTSIFNK